MAERSSAPDLVIITGMSGAGRTDAMHTFEDLGYYCIDNLPPLLLEQVVELAGLDDPQKPRLTVVCDIRALEFSSTFVAALDALTQKGVRYEVLFLEASDSALLNRFKASRRKHPLISDGRIIDGILKERELLVDVRQRANALIDTSNLKPRDLSKAIAELYVGTESSSDFMNITVGSFGYKFGIPSEADLVIDVRFLPNPYYVPELRELTGLDEPVRAFVLEKPEVQAFLEKWYDLLDVLMPGYVNEGKHHLYIAVGCTGGQHRSVVLAEATAEYLKDRGYRLDTVHRNLPRK